VPVIAVTHRELHHFQGHDRNRVILFSRASNGKWIVFLMRCGI
jgi:hypothetical protein